MRNSVQYTINKTRGVFLYDNQIKHYKLLMILVCFFVSPFLQANSKAPSWVSEGPYLKESPVSFEIPIDVFSTKLYVEVELGGKPRRFVFDTGSPSMIDAVLVKELGLKAVGRNKGVDAHGTVVETRIVQTNIHIGGIAIHKVPMMEANFSKSELTKTLIGDGVLGSDLFPLGAWQFDLKDSVLRFSTTLNQLPHIKESTKLKLYQFGYPYMPIFDVRFEKKARSKALFDTGASTFFAISSQDLHGAKKAGGVGKVINGYGSPGSSLGGQAPDTTLVRAELKALAIDKLKLESIVAAERHLNPSLIGAKILEKYIVTLDARTQSAYFKKYSDKPIKESSFGFSLAFNNTISIGAVWDDSPAKAAGLKTGVELVEINGVQVEFSKKGLLRAISAMEGKEIELKWKDGSTKLFRKELLP